MKILVLNDLNRDDACFWIRIGFHLERLKQAGIVETYDLNDIEKYQTADLVIIQRHVDLSPSLIGRMLAAPKPVLYETDDFLPRLPEHHPVYAHYSVHAFLSWHFFKHFVTAISVSTDPLRHYFARCHRNTRVVKNTLPHPFTAGVFSGDAHQAPLKIGYAGSATHEQDYEFVIDTLTSIQKIYAGRVEFHFIGWVPSRLRQHASGLCRYPYETNYLRYLQAVRAMHLDIGLAPLLDSEFNRAKSAIKYMEYTYFGAVGIYSDVEPYRSIRGGIVLKNEANQWHDALSGLIENPGRRADLHGLAVDQVKDEFCFENELAKWTALMDLAARKPRPVNARRLMAALEKDVLADAEHRHARYCEFLNQFSPWIRHSERSRRKGMSQETTSSGRVSSQATGSQHRPDILHDLRVRAAAAVHKCGANNVRSLAVYGAGSHTEALLPLLQELGGPAVKQIVVSAAGPKQDFCGIPVLSMDEFDPSRVDAVLLSSHTYETEMFYALKSRFFDVRVFPLWNSEEDFELYHNLKRLLRCVAEKCRVEGIRRIAVYGAGSHTRLLLPIWRGWHGPEIQCILVSERPENTDFMGLPVVEAAQFDPADTDAILLSSRSYEREMFRACSQYWPHLPVYPVWDAYEEPLANRLRNRIPAILHKCAVHNVRTVALYGAGLHTRMLLPAWQKAHGPEVKQIVVTSTPEKRQFMGCPVVPADEFNPESVDAIVLSSSDYEEPMYQTCRRLWPGTNVFPVWDFKLSKKPAAERPFGLSGKSSYEKWFYRNRLTAKIVDLLRREMSELACTPWFSLIMPVYNTPGDFLEQAIESVCGQIYQNWELCVVDDGSTTPAVAETLEKFTDRDKRIRCRRLPVNRGIVPASNEALAMATGDYLVPMDHDDILEPDALIQIAKYLEKNPGTDVLYTDNDKIGCANRLLGPVFKPAWSPEFLHSWCYIYHLKIFSRKIVAAIGPLNPEFECAQDYDYFLRAAERAAKVGHLPLVLYHHRILEGQSSASSSSQVNGQRAVEAHIRRRRLDWVRVEQPAFARASGNGIYRLSMNESVQEKVSVLLLAHTGFPEASRCLASLVQNAGGARFAVTIITHRELTHDERMKLEELHPDIEFVAGSQDTRQTGEWHALIHTAARQAPGEYLLLVDARNTIAGPGWLENLLVYAKMPEIGVVGGKVLRPNRKSHQVGLIKGFRNGLVAHALKDLNREDPGYLHAARVARNCIAVTRDCMMMKKSLFVELGGFDPAMTGELADADLCLRAQELGLRVVCTPFVECNRSDGARDDADGPESLRAAMEFRKRWDCFIDPYYNPNLNTWGTQSYEVAAQKNLRLGQFDLNRRGVKILSFSHNLNYEGAPYVKLKIDRFLAAQSNVKLDVISAEDGPLRQEYAACGIDVSILDCPNEICLAKYEAFRDALSARIKNGGYDAVYINTLMLYWAVDAAYAAGVPSIWNIHESIDYLKFYEERIPNPAVRAAAQSAIGKANRLVFVCHATADMFAAYDPFGVTEVIYNGIDAARFTPASPGEKQALRKRLRLPPEGKLVTIVGTVCPRKGQLDFVRCAAALIASGSKDHFVIVGKREAPYLAAYLSQVKQVAARYPDQIHLIPETPALDYVRASDLFVCSSYQESFPMVVLEAMSCGLPIVTTPVYGIAEQVEDGRSALFYQPGDLEQMNLNIQKCLSDGRFAADIGGMARAAVETTFSESRMVEAYREILQQVATEDMNDAQWLSMDTAVHNPAEPVPTAEQSREQAGLPAKAPAQAGLANGGLRAALSAQYLAGEGIEIGALHNPMVLPPGTEVKYVDRLSVADLRRQYPELADAALVPVDIVDDGEKLATILDESQDFVLANHFIEHCQNPIMALQNMIRVLKVGGVLFLAVPDKRFTFDAKRDVTSFDHLVRDYLEGPEWSRRSHFRDWVRGVHSLEEPDEIERKMQDLLKMDYSIHYHVWTQADIMEWIARMMPVLQFDVEQMSRNGMEVIFILRKAAAREGGRQHLPVPAAVSDVPQCQESCR